MMTPLWLGFMIWGSIRDNISDVIVIINGPFTSPAFVVKISTDYRDNNA